MKGSFYALCSLTSATKEADEAPDSKVWAQGSAERLRWLFQHPGRHGLTAAIALFLEIVLFKISCLYTKILTIDGHD